LETLTRTESIKLALFDTYHAERMYCVVFDRIVANAAKFDREPLAFSLAVERVAGRIPPEQRYHYSTSSSWAAL